MNMRRKCNDTLYSVCAMPSNVVDVPNFPSCPRGTLDGLREPIMLR